MKRVSDQEIGIECPTCGMFNEYDSVVCIQCGHSMYVKGTAPQRPDEQSRAEQIREAHQAVLTNTPDILKRNALRARHSRQLVTFFGVTCAIILLVVLLWNRIQVLQWEQQIEAQYQTALRCFDSREYLCSRDNLSELLKEAPNYPGAEDLLIAARWELAQEYIGKGQWEQAAAELTVLLHYENERPEIRATLAQTYDARIQEAQARGDLGEVVRLNLERLSTLGI